MNEQQKYEVIKELADHGTNKNTAALKLGLSVRQVNRLIKVYREKGKAGFVHGNRDRLPTNSTPPELSNTILTLYRTKYQGFNFSHFKDLLELHEHIHVSSSFLYKLLTKNGFDSPKIQKKTKRKRARQRALAAKPNIDPKDIVIVTDHEVPLADSHPRKERCKYFGEEIQMDASIHVWFGDVRSALHLAADNATGIIVGGYFQKEETLKGYYTLFHQILTHYGIPYSFKTDRRTVFNYERSQKKTDQDDVLTQFGYACKTLGVQLHVTSVSQAKGLIERDNGTFQGRLVNELRLAGIHSLDEANDYLLHVFIPFFNRRFALDPKNFDSAFEASPSSEKINYTLAVLSSRQLDNGSAIKFFGHYYQLHDSYDCLVCFKPRTKCLVIQAFDGQLFATVDDKVYILRELSSHKHLSPDLDVFPPAPAKRKINIPSMSHPWKHDSFLKQLELAHRYHIFD